MSLLKILHLKIVCSNTFSWTSHSFKKTSVFPDSTMREIGRILGTRDSFKWRITDFLNLAVKYSLCWSPDFYYNGQRWYFQICPNGNGNNGYVELRLVKGGGNSISISFSLSIETVNGEKHMERQCTKNFGDGFDFQTYTEFISKAELVRKKSDLVPSGVLTIVFTTEFPTPASEDNITTASCSYCKKAFDAQKLPKHEKKCRIKCPECSDVILLQNWDKHECQVSRTEAATNTTESFVAHHQGTILQDFKQIFLKQENCDVVLKVKGWDFPAHKIILAARSSVFESTFRSDMKEKETGIVEIEDCDPFVFSDFLCFLYSNDVDNLSEENVFGLFTAADKYDITDLRRKCLEFMKENLFVETFCETLSLALQHSEAALIHLATDFFIKNAKNILVTVKWQSFAAENFTKSNELFIKYVEAVQGPNI